MAYIVKYFLAGLVDVNFSFNQVGFRSEQTNDQEDSYNNKQSD